MSLGQGPRRGRPAHKEFRVSRKRSTAKSLGINLAAFGVDAPAKKPGKKRGQMNSLEKAFGETLERLTWARSLVDRYRYEAVTLRVCSIEVGSGKKGDTKYTPDFQITNKWGSQTYFETKGRRRPQDIQRLRMAAQEWPEHAFFLVTRQSTKSPWVLEPYGSKAVETLEVWQQAVNIATMGVFVSIPESA